MKDAIRRSSVVISGNQRLLMEDAIRWSSEVIKSQSVVISGHQRHSHLWDRSDRNQRSSSRNQTVISGHQRHSHLWNRADRSAPLAKRYTRRVTPIKPHQPFAQGEQARDRSEERRLT